MRLIFMGTPEFAAPFLRALHQAGHDIAAVYTQPPREGGRRGLSLQKSPVHLAAELRGLPVHTPKTLRDSAEQARFAALNADIAIIVAYGLLLPEAILNAPRLGCYNAHGSLLPRWRGAAPIQRAIEAGDKEIGIVIMRMDKGLDTGPILCAGGAPAAGGAGESGGNGADGAAAKPFIYKMPIDADMTAGEAFAALAEAGARLMTQAVAALADGNFSLEPQPQQGATYARKIDKIETRLNWWRQSAEKLHRQICAFSPSPGAWCEMEIGGQRERVRILASHLPNAAELEAARCQGLLTLNPQAANRAPAPAKSAHLAVQCGGEEGRGAADLLFLTRLQKAGGKALSAQEFLRGAAPTAIL